MIRLGLGRHVLGIGATVILLTGCGGSPSATSGGLPASAIFARAMTGPPTCKDQRSKKKYGSMAVKLKTKGGSFCIPAFGGFGGWMPYPGVDRQVKLTIRTSTENIYNEPQLGTGTSIIYLNLHFHAGTRFGSSFKSKSGTGLSSQSISPGSTYTAYGIVAVGHLDLMFPPCYTVAVREAGRGVLPHLGELFSGTTITGAGYGVIEIYSGEQVSQEC
ncbi:MAG: hypothetical protein WAK84_02270 [Candidatus Cybelea sp.]